MVASHVVFKCISLMADDKHLFMCLLPIFITSLVKHLYISFAHFINGLLKFKRDNYFKTNLYNLDTNLLPDMYFLPICGSVACLFIFLRGFHRAKDLILMKFNFSTMFLRIPFFFHIYYIMHIFQLCFKCGALSFSKSFEFCISVVNFKYLVNVIALQNYSTG